MFKPFSLDTLKDLDDGRPAVAFDQAVRSVTNDCRDRPGDKRPRKVTLEFVATPVVSEEGICDLVTGEFKIKTVLPHRQTKPYELLLNRQGQLFFSENSPDAVDQTTLDDIGPDGRVERGSID